MSYNIYGKYNSTNIENFSDVQEEDTIIFTSSFNLKSIQKIQSDFPLEELEGAVFTWKENIQQTLKVLIGIK